MLTPREEQIYLDGGRMAWLFVLNEAVRQLGYRGVNGTPILTEAAWIADRTELVACLRDLCRNFGDNDWPDNLNLTDVVEKHLAKYLYRRQTTS